MPPAWSRGLFALGRGDGSGNGAGEPGSAGFGVLHRDVKKYGIPDFHPHKLRHTSASIAITNGADVVSVSERLGHSDTAITLRLYAHANEESIRKAGQIVRDALKKEQAK